MNQRGFSNILVVIVAFAVLIAAGVAGFLFFSEEQPIPRVQNPPPEFPPAPIIVTDTFSNTIDGWRVYSNEVLGISFSYPKEYCVGFFNRRILSEWGWSRDLSGPDYYLRIGDSQETDCLALSEPGPPDIFDITVYVNRDRESLESWQSQFDPMGEIKEFDLPPITIDGIQGFRSLTGEGTTNKGAPFYNISFLTDDLIFVLGAHVNCTAKDGICKPPRDYGFIAEIDKIVKTIQFIR